MCLSPDQLAQATLLRNALTFILIGAIFVGGFCFARGKSRPVTLILLAGIVFAIWLLVAGTPLDPCQ